MTRTTRTEHDSLGDMEIPDDAYYGVQTARAMVNFPVSGQRERPELIKAYVLVKKVAALTNRDLGLLDPTIAEAILEAADEALSGGFNDHFTVDVFQAGAGTSFNMNTNEVIANRALEILGRKRGEYEHLSPNDHVNMAQSTNDSFPTASHIAIVHATDPLIEIIQDLANALGWKGDEFLDVPKSGRTHLMDATPMTLGHEFHAYAYALRRAVVRIEQRRFDLLELPIGGTAVGSGVNAHPEYRTRFLSHLEDLTGPHWRHAANSFEALQSRSIMASYSGAIRELAQELIKIANDLRLLGSGPTTSLAEIRLPAVQPGSSIMPGKVNPVMAECLNMICFHVIGNDTAVSLAAQAGQLELNVMTPVMIHNILESISLLSNYLPVFRERCIEGIQAEREHCLSHLELNPSQATLLNPRIGYLKAAELAKESFGRGIPVKELAVEKGILTREEAEELFDPKRSAKGLYD
jgi:aspartate ammonia-lyase